jgi:lysozyme family protein
MTVDQLIDAVLNREGGFVDHPADRGGATNFGITEQVARAHGYQGKMRDLPREVAKAIYRSMYWQRPGFDQVATRMPDLAAELFDGGVNMGPKTLATFLQRALNVLNRGAFDYPDIVADGDVGALTLHSIDRLRAKRPDAETLLLRAVIALKRARYIRLAEANPSQEAFEVGWLSRQAVAA